MDRKVLRNAPLVEAIFELRWALQETVPGMRIDPHYKVLIGRIYDKLKDEYPFHEQLPTAAIPDGLIEHVVQQRFRKGENQWPVFQLGPGLITVNDTEGYEWDDFEKRIVQAVESLFELYPESENSLKTTHLILRYIDAIKFDFRRENILEFLSENLKTTLTLDNRLFESTGIAKLPLGFDWRIEFRSSKPTGTVHLRFGKGKKKETEALIWETIVQSSDEDIPVLPGMIRNWLRDAHGLTHDWFFKLIEGELIRRFE